MSGSINSFNKRADEKRGPIRVPQLSSNDTTSSDIIIPPRRGNENHWASYSCPECQRLFCRGSAANEHRRKTHGLTFEQILAAPLQKFTPDAVIANQITRSDEKIPETIATVDSSSQSNKKISYVCPECHKVLSCLSAVNKHRRNIHKMTREQRQAKPEQQAPPGAILDSRIKTDGVEDVQSLLATLKNIDWKEIKWSEEDAKAISKIATEMKESAEPHSSERKQDLTCTFCAEMFGTV